MPRTRSRMCRKLWSRSSEKRMLRWAALGALFASCSTSARAADLSFQLFTLGLEDPLHTSADGLRNSEAALFNAAGQVVGYSGRPVNDSWVMGSNWIWDGDTTRRIGLTDVEHTSTSGMQMSIPFALNNAGQVAGASWRFQGAEGFGLSAWVYSAGTTTRVGLLDSQHTRIDGYRQSEVETLNNRGDAVGYSSSFDTLDWGRSVWIYTHGTTQRLGFTDASHTDANGRQFTVQNSLNDAGQVIGSSSRYGTFGEDTNAWFFASGQTHQLGLTDGPYTASDGRQHSEAMFLNNNGVVAGTSRRFSGTEEFGETLWLYQNGVTTLAGLSDAEHTATDGRQFSQSYFLTESGYLGGTSSRFSGNDFAGATAWIYHAGTHQLVGLTDSEHTGPNGMRFSSIDFLKESGVAGGSSSHFPGPGTSAWVYNGISTTRAGLTNAGHTNESGGQTSFISKMNEAGQALGGSGRYGTPGYNGNSTWFFADGVTTQIGLIDAQHTRDDDYQHSFAELLNEAGQAAGYSLRFDGANPLGQSGFFYDHSTNQTTPLVFSEAANGDAYTMPWFLSEQGAVAGIYRKYESEPSSINGFYWSLADGFHELSDLLDGGAASSGWLRLDAPFAADPDFRHFVGNGMRQVGAFTENRAYLLSVIGGGGWNNPAGGPWQVNSNWNLSNAPTFHDDAVFALNSTYTVTLQNDAQAHGVLVSAGTVTINLSGHTLNAPRAVTIDAARLKITNGTLKTNEVSIANGGWLDLTGGAMIVDYSEASSFNQIKLMIALGRNGGLWNGPGINAASAFDPSMSIGVVDNTVLGLSSFGGMAVDSTTILLRLTLNGDANLDGLVNITDLYSLALHWQTASPWSSGDFDYSGFVDLADLKLLASNWPADSVELAPMLATLGLPTTGVPEPGAILGLSAVSILLNRRERRLVKR